MATPTDTLSDERIEERLGAFAQFRALGLDENDALRLTLEDASFSRARSLLENGCPPGLVAEILA